MKTISIKIKIALIVVVSFILLTCVEDHVLPNFGSIFVTSDPIGAKIFLDDEDTGKVTPDSLVELLSGDYKISISMNEFFDTSFTADVNDGQLLNYNLFLKEENPDGEIQLTSVPSGAEIFINNSNTGETTPATFNNLERGAYQVKLTLDLYDDSEFTVQLSKDQKVEKNTRMIIAGTAGSLFITSNPTGAKIILDNFDTGEVTPDTIKPLAAGIYQIGLQLDNYKDTTFSSTVTTGLLTSENIRLKALYNIDASVNPTDAGTIMGAGGYVEGDEVVLEATAETGYSFVNWTENSNEVSKDPTYTFTANANRSLVANFSLNSYIIATSSNPLSGGATSGGGVFDYGSIANLSAVPSSGYTFINWTEDDSPVHNERNFSFTVTEDRNLRANFSLNSYVVTTSSNPENGGTTSGGGGYDFGDEVTVTATPAIGFTFVNWTENGNEVSNQQNYTFTVNGSRDIVANFLINSYVVTVNANPSEAGSIEGVGSYNHGQNVTLSATPNFGYSFVNWTENSNEVSDEEEYSFIIESDRNIIANFIENGNIFINSDPVGANIFLNNNFIGDQTPFTIENLLPNNYSITLRLEDFADTTLITEVESGLTTNLGSIFLRDITPKVEVTITYSVNPTTQRLEFSFLFNQTIFLSRIGITTANGDFFLIPFNATYLEGIPVNWGFPEKLEGTWRFNFIGNKVGGRQDNFNFEETKLVE